MTIGEHIASNWRERGTPEWHELSAEIDTALAEHEIYARREERELWFKALFRYGAASTDVEIEEAKIDLRPLLLKIVARSGEK